MSKAVFGTFETCRPAVPVSASGERREVIGGGATDAIDPDRTVTPAHSTVLGISSARPGARSMLFGLEGEAIGQNCSRDRRALSFHTCCTPGRPFEERDRTPDDEPNATYTFRV
jgi:hypothetical protein